MAEIESPLPHNKEAEAIILGTVMVEQGLVPVLINGITREDFYLPSHQVVYAAIRDLCMSHKVIDPITIWDRIQAIEADGRPSGMNLAGLAALLDGTARIKDERYLLGLMETVKTAALRRRLIRYGEYLANQAKQPDVTVERLVSDMTRRAVEYANDSGESSDLIDSQAAVSRTLSLFEEQWNREDGFLGLRTGFSDLDRLLQGLRGGSVYIIASATNMGKTTLALNMVNGILDHDPQAVGLLVSMEMPVQQLVAKFLSTQTMLPTQAIESGRDGRGHSLDKAATRQILMQSDKLAARNVFFLEGFKKTAPTLIEAKLERIRAMKQRVDFMVLDYLQLMSGDGRPNASRYDIVTDLSRDIKRLAVRFNIPVILISQLSREYARRAKTGFQVSDLRDSGSVEQDADVIMFVEPEDWDDPTKPGRKLVIAKNRQGPKDVLIPLVFFGHQSRFVGVESVEYGEGA